jgi:tellurite resistance protein
MDDSDLISGLHGLGIHETDHRLLLLLPLIQVAWADGEVQDAERTAVLSVAHDKGWMGANSRPTLEAWLRFRPSAGYFRKANDILRGLAAREDGRLAPQSLLDLCQTVAEAAGGFFGIRSVDAEERAVLTALADALRVQPGTIDLRDAPADADWSDPDITEVSGFVVAAHPPPVQDAEAGPALRVSGFPTLDLRLNQPAVTVGRQAPCELQLRGDPLVSRRHCEVHLSDGQWVVTDSGSTHGTYVDGERILSRPLFGDEVIQIGGYSLRFQP